MARNHLARKGAPTDYFYLMPRFAKREDAQAAVELLQGLCENHIEVYDKKVTQYGETVAGKCVLEVFAVPNRSYHLEDIAAHLQERHFAASTARTYVTELVREGYIYKVGVLTYARKHDGPPTPAVCPDVDVDTADA